MPAGISLREKLRTHIGTAVNFFISHMNLLHNLYHPSILQSPLAYRMRRLAIESAF